MPYQRRIGVIRRWVEKLSCRNARAQLLLSLIPKNDALESPNAGTRDRDETFVNNSTYTKFHRTCQCNFLRKLEGLHRAKKQAPWRT